MPAEEAIAFALAAGPPRRQLPPPETAPEAPQPGNGYPAGLTAREVEILRLLAAGARNPAIAQRLVVSPHTIKRHVANVLQKLNAVSRTEAAMRARELGIV